jgi:hypothetical protein
MWPYSWNKCYASNPTGYTGYDYLLGNKNNGCDSNPPYGFKPNVARSMPELDIFEVMIFSSAVNSTIDSRSVASLQLAPLMAEGLSILDDETKDGVCLEESLPVKFQDQWCTRPYDGAADGGPGLCLCSPPNGPNALSKGWCAANMSDPTSKRSRPGNVVQDSMSGVYQLNDSHFSSFHTYGMLWTPSSSPLADDGLVRFYIDGAPWYEVRETALKERLDEMGNVLAYERKIPREPMYIILNLALSYQWTPISSSLSSQLPAELLVDYIRVYQPIGSNHSETLSCSPPSYPTSQYVACNPWK